MTTNIECIGNKSLGLEHYWIGANECPMNDDIIRAAQNCDPRLRGHLEVTRCVEAEAADTNTEADLSAYRDLHAEFAHVFMVTVSMYEA